MNAEHQRERFAAYKAVAQKAIQVVADLPLPDYFTDPTCNCAEGGQVFVVTEGYSQWCNTEIDYETIDDETIDDETTGEDPKPVGLRAWTDGWDDMSENGDYSYLICAGCHTVWAMPEDLAWN